MNRELFLKLCKGGMWVGCEVEKGILKSFASLLSPSFRTMSVYTDTLSCPKEKIMPKNLRPSSDKSFLGVKTSAGPTPHHYSPGVIHCLRHSWTTPIFAKGLVRFATGEILSNKGKDLCISTRRGFVKELKGILNERLQSGIGVGIISRSRFDLCGGKFCVNFVVVKKIKILKSQIGETFALCSSTSYIIQWLIRLWYYMRIEKEKKGKKGRAREGINKDWKIGLKLRCSDAKFPRRISDKSFRRYFQRALGRRLRLTLLKFIGK
ncbi:hypothetical protein CEXT_340801 [Caerostris extrusa]|uniref:Uncharacterized protein n=1 Tax=Caerostris extrusa TaxID=172846 RepID=A0AAV4S6K7_CAEEX|nr:hypothetical protein CEXT_340801 [Caerostris extrusa]